MKLLYFSSLMIAIACPAVETLTFDASPTPNVSYAIKTGTSPGTYQNVISIGTNLMLSLTNGPWGRIFCVAVAISTNGIESAPSNELVCTNRPGAPVTLRLAGPNQGLRVLASEDGIAWNLLGIYTNTPLLLSIRQRQMIKAATISLPPIP